MIVVEKYFCLQTSLFRVMTASLCVKPSLVKVFSSFGYLNDLILHNMITLNGLPCRRRRSKNHVWQFYPNFFISNLIWFICFAHSHSLVTLVIMAVCNSNFFLLALFYSFHLLFLLFPLLHIMILSSMFLSFFSFFFLLLLPCESYF